MLVTRSLALGGGALVGVLATAVGAFGGSTVATPCGLAVALVVGPFSEGFSDDLVTGTAAGALGGVLFTLTTFVLGTARFASLTGDLAFAIDFGLRTALPIALSFIALFALEGLVASVAVGWSLRRLSSP